MVVGEERSMPPRPPHRRRLKSGAGERDKLKKAHLPRLQAIRIHAQLGCQLLVWEVFVKLDVIGRPGRRGGAVLVGIRAMGLLGREPVRAAMPPPAPDTDRVIVHLDADGFYAQCEELRNPGLRGRPVGAQ